MQALAHRRTISLGAIAALVLSLVVAVGSGTPAHAAFVSISGTVSLPADAPIEYYEGVFVYAVKLDGTPVNYDYVSLSDGTYTIGDLAPGEYKVWFRAGRYSVTDGYLDPPLVSEYYNDQTTLGSAAPVDVTSGNATGIDATLAWATGSISGTVSLDAGIATSSLTGLQAVAQPNTGSQPQWALVDPVTGAYEIAHLAEGTYTVYFTPNELFGGDMTIAPEYFDNVFDVNDATAVTIWDGDHYPGVDAQVGRVGGFTSAPIPVITHLKLTSGSTLGITTGDWAPAPDAFTMRWYRNGVAISGATKAQYELTTADRGKTITFKLTAKKSGYTTVTKTSAGLYIPKVFTKTVMPTIHYEGSLAAGRVLTAYRGTWTPAASSSKYKWKRDGVAITGATSKSYTLTTADRGHEISVSVTGMRAGYADKTRTSVGLKIPKVFTTTKTPTISGTAKAGHTLTAHRGTWSPTPKYSYQWYRNGAKISGATNYKYTLKSADKGKKITVKVTGKKSGYLTASKTSAAKTVAK